MHSQFLWQEGDVFGRGLYSEFTVDEALWENCDKNQKHVLPVKQDMNGGQEETAQEKKRERHRLVIQFMSQSINLY